MNFKARRPGFLLGWQMNAAELMFRGLTDDQICEELWPNDKISIHSKRNRIKRLRQTEEFKEYYDSLVKEWGFHHVGKALNKLAEQIDSDKPWIANKAANDVLIQSKQYMAKDDENTVVVKFDGGINLGSPEQEE